MCAIKVKWPTQGRAPVYEVVQDQQGNQYSRVVAPAPISTPYGSRHVPGAGPIPCRMMLIGEGPGARENISGRPFVGESGQLLDRLLMQHGLDRDAIYVTNLAKYHVPGNNDPTASDIARDLPELEMELEAVDPEFVGLLGRVAARHFLGDINMEWAHGLTFFKGRRFMPMYHPAYGLHSPAALPLVAEDIRRFAAMVKGKQVSIAPVDEFPKPKYILLRDKLPVAPDAHQHWVGPGKGSQMLPIYIDTEGSIDQPWGLSFTQQPGKAYVLLASNKKLLAQFQSYLKFCGTVVLHNAMHDIGVLRAMGITFSDFRDTMVTAYHLCLEPQGLKPLARRHAGMVMDSYNDVVGAARKKKSVKYFKGVLAWLGKHWVEESETFSKALKKKKATTATPKSSTARTRKSTTSSDGTSSKKISRQRLPSSSKN